MGGRRPQGGAPLSCTCQSRKRTAASPAQPHPEPSPGPMGCEPGCPSLGPPPSGYHRCPVVPSGTRDEVSSRQRGGCRSGQWKSLCPLSPVTSLSLQDHQELRTSEHPAQSLCQEPPPALHVSRAGAGPGWGSPEVHALQPEAWPWPAGGLGPAVPGVYFVEDLRFSAKHPRGSVSGL